MKNKFLFALTLVLLSSASNLYAREIDTNTAKLQAMNKLTGKVSVLEAPVNGEVKFGSFSIVVRACKTRPPEETPDNFAFVDVVDKHEDGSEVNIFKGWMVSSSPALHAVAHPIYDVWLLQCENTQVDTSKLLSAEELAARDEIVMAEQLPEQSNLLSENADISQDNATKNDLLQDEESSSLSQKEISSDEKVPQNNAESQASTNVKDTAPTPKHGDTVFETEAAYENDESDADGNKNLVIFTTEPAPKSADGQQIGPESLIKPDSSDAVLYRSDNTDDGSSDITDNEPVDVVLPDLGTVQTTDKQISADNNVVSGDNGDDVNSPQNIDGESSLDDGQPNQLIMFEDDSESLVPQSL